ncbi:neuritin [Micropterus salmoides]|uniref:neuritin n=1 Tax=Micropterus salmoides TaxID=27706 RepID=UPI0018EB472E|nr:neuritin [Micropterus salmoides]
MACELCADSFLLEKAQKNIADLKEDVRRLSDELQQRNSLLSSFKARLPLLSNFDAVAFPPLVADSAQTSGQTTSKPLQPPSRFTTSIARRKILKEVVLRRSRGFPHPELGGSRPTRSDAASPPSPPVSTNGVDSLDHTPSTFSVLQTVLVSAGQCDSVFKGFSDCLLQLGENMANYPQDLDDRENLHKICSYWDNFHSCATTALADCQEGATDLWEKLKKESRSLDFRGSLFELCGGGNAAPRSADARGLALVLTTLPTILTWLAF